MKQMIATVPMAGLISGMRMLVRHADSIGAVDQRGLIQVARQLHDELAHQKDVERASSEKAAVP